MSTRLEAAPVASVRVISGPVQVLPAPGRSSTELTQAGQVLIIVVDAPGLIEITVRSMTAGVNPEASFSLDLLDRGDAMGVARGEQASAPARGEDQGAPPLQIEAHVSRVGDVRVSAGEWIAGPALPLPIEGLAVMGGQHSTALEVQVQSAARPGAWSGWFGHGQFAGTRQRAEPLTGVRLRLNKESTEKFAIVAEALFLGAPVIKNRGSFIEFVSQDPLVGLRVDVVEEFMSQLTASQSTGRVQVFRAQ